VFDGSGSSDDYENDSSSGSGSSSVGASQSSQPSSGNSSQEYDADDLDPRDWWVHALGEPRPSQRASTAGRQQRAPAGQLAERHSAVRGAGASPSTHGARDWRGSDAAGEEVLCSLEEHWAELVAERARARAAADLQAGRQPRPPRRSGWGARPRLLLELQRRPLRPRGPAGGGGTVAAPHGCLLWAALGLTANVQHGKVRGKAWLFVCGDYVPLVLGTTTQMQKTPL
jgi:hypothetical protein